MSEDGEAQHPRGDAGGAPALSDDERRRMVAEAAYYRALARGFRGGSPEQDWYAAEREIERAYPRARPPAGADRQRDVAAYAALRARVAELLGEAGTLVDTATVGRALSRAQRDVRDGGHASGEAVGRAAQAVRIELAHAVEALDNALESASARTPPIFDAWRGRGEPFLAQGAAAVRSWLHEIGVRAGTHRAGELTFAGTLQCRRCGTRTTLAEAGHVPACAHCGHGEFLRRER